MGQFRRIRDHAQRLRRQFGALVPLGPRSYRIPGYVSNILDIDSSNEREIRAVIGRLLSERTGCFVDVGANLGQTLGSVLSVDPDRSYLGFEPQVSACYFVQRFLQDNGLRNARILPIGLSDRDGILRFWVAGAADVAASLIERHGDDMREISIPVRRGDAVLAELGIGGIAAIKIDVEGAEREVVNGFSGTLTRQRPPVLFEVLPNFEGEERRMLPEAIARRQSSAAEALAALFHELGYRIASIDPQGREIPIDRFALDDRAGFVGWNYIARPV